MNQYHTQEEEPLHSQRMTNDEAQALIQLWAERQRERDQQAALPSVQDIADVLQVPAQEAALLLQELRARRATMEQQVKAPPMHRQRTIHPLVVAAAITGALLLFLFAVMFAMLVTVAPTPVAPRTAPSITVIDTPGPTTPSAAPEGMTPPAAGSEPAPAMAPSAASGPAGR